MEEKLKLADEVLDNNGSQQQLEKQVGGSSFEKAAGVGARRHRVSKQKDRDSWGKRLGEPHRLRGSGQQVACSACTAGNPACGASIPSCSLPAGGGAGAAAKGQGALVGPAQLPAVRGQHTAGGCAQVHAVTRPRRACAHGAAFVTSEMSKHVHTTYMCVQASVDTDPHRSFAAPRAHLMVRSHGPEVGRKKNS